ncbi:MAG: RagB/SusD family nutrient uptake outer membrane protein [Bacteroidota bacterium]|nr:RagB/SusD family nutrient uptake outer membrane protein [Bacteroidota bacterium]
MKRINKIFTAGLLSILALSSCKKDELDLFPFSSIEVSQSFVSLKDAKAWDVGFYNSFRGNVYGSTMFIPDVQADQLNATLDFGNRNGNPHRWGISFLAEDGALSGLWASYYSAIKNINVAIDGFEKIPTANATEKTELDRYKGDAYLARAYYYSDLVKRYAKAYNPSSAATDLGVPLITVYDLNDKPARATVAQVYTQILSDITKAKTLLTAFVGTQGSKAFTLHSALALEARVKLETRDYAGAVVAAETVIASGTYPLVTNQTDMNAMWRTDLAREVIMQCFVSKPIELPNVNSIYLGFIPATGKFAPDFVPSQWVIDRFENADIRKAAYFERKLLTIQGVDYPNIWTVNKYPGNVALFTTAATNYAHAPKVFRVAELYLISAESGARAGASTEAAALTRLNTLRVSRGLPALGALSGTPLIDAIKDERFRELAFEGFRLWDLKRWNEGFTRSAPQNLNFINVGANYNTLSVPAGSDKITWGVPTRDLTTNPNLVQNAGW